MRKDSLWVSTVQISLSKLVFVVVGFFVMSESEGDCYSGCKSWEKAKKPIACVKTNCVCYCGHSIGKINMYTYIMENMIVSLSIRRAISRTPRHNFVLFSALCCCL